MEKLSIAAKISLLALAIMWTITSIIIITGLLSGDTSIVNSAIGWSVGAPIGAGLGYLYIKE